MDHRPTQSAGPLILIAALAALLTAGCELARPEPADGLAPGDSLTIAAGEDYALPDGVAAEPYSGYVNHPRRGDPAIGGGQRSVWIGWKDLEPERGVYDWTAVEEALDAAEANGYAVSLHLLSIVCGGYSASRDITVPGVVPDWVLEAFDLQDEEQQINLGWEFDIRVIPAWRPEIRAAFEALVRAFGERGYPHRDALGSAYVHGISLSRGEEFWLLPTDLEPLENEAGLTPPVLEQWLGARLQTYADAFAGAEHKLAWVGTYEAWRYCDPRYVEVVLRLIQRAWDLGIGTRHGAIERYNLCVNDPAFGLSVDADGYRIVDESIPPIASVRYYGDENEEYGDAWVSRFGSRDGEAHRYRFAMLSALQRRLRFLWTSTAAEQINPPLSEYARLSFGKSVTGAPDAWAYLCQTPARTGESPAGAVKNLERWLRQRDVPGGMTVPAEQVFRPYSTGVEPAGQNHDHVARRTDIAAGSPCIYFDLDDRFLVDGPVLVKVEYRDEGRGAWRLEYLDAGGLLCTTPTVRNRDDGEVKTATFTLADADFAGGLPHGMDFRIACDGPQDVAVRWVRVIRNLDGG